MRSDEQEILKNLLHLRNQKCGKDIHVGIETHSSLHQGNSYLAVEARKSVRFVTGSSKTDKNCMKSLLQKHGTSFHDVHVQFTVLNTWKKKRKKK